MLESVPRNNLYLLLLAVVLAAVLMANKSQQPTSLEDRHNGTEDLVISCVDYRFRSYVDDWIENELKRPADLHSIAGASKALLLESEQEYQPSLYNIGLVAELHGVTMVHIIDHEDCGAYNGSGEHESWDHEHTFHCEKCDMAAEIIQKKHPHLAVKTYLMKKDGTVELLDFFPGK